MGRIGVRFVPFALCVLGGLLLVWGAATVVQADQEHPVGHGLQAAVRSADLGSADEDVRARAVIAEREAAAASHAADRPEGAPRGERVLAASSTKASGVDGYARVRAALDLVGGGDVGLEESSSCAGGTAAACANSNGYIKYRSDVATWSDDRLNWAMAHELAHIHQFQVWGALNDSDGYHRLFGGDPEFLANCMALVRGYAGAVGCDADQQAWASAIWVGAVR
ncbi:hypothetical protein M2317_003649 [Microbacterium sp. ZKA21]